MNKPPLTESPRQGAPTLSGSPHPVRVGVPPCPGRNGTADLLKGLAVVFMVQVHIMEQFGTRELYGSIIGQASLFLGGPACAPVFLAVMGYFLASGAKTLSYYLKRGILLLIGGILLNVFRSANLLIHILNGEINLTPWPFIWGVDILPLAGISLILTGLFRNLFKSNAWLYLATALVIAGISPLVEKTTPGSSISQYLRAFFTGSQHWSYFPVFPWMSYILTGLAFRLSLKHPVVAEKTSALNLQYYVIPIWIGLVISLPWASRITHTLDGTGGYYHHGILFYGWVTAFIIAYSVAISLLEINHGEIFLLKFIRWIGRNVTLVYVIQWLIIGNLATNLYQSQGLLGWLGWFVAIFVITLILTWLILWASGKISRLKKIHAVHQ